MVWDKIKGSIFESEGDTETAAPAKPGAQPTGAPQGAAPKPGMTYVPAPTVNTAMVDAIRKQTFARNTALTALITASEALVDIIPDPVMRLKAAHKTAAGGRSAKDISDAVAIHMQDVDGEELRFSKTLEATVNGEVGTLNRQAEAAEQAAAAANNEIASLQQRINMLHQQAGENATKATTLRAEAQARHSELAQHEAEFKAAAQVVRNELNGHKNTILSTLG